MALSLKAKEALRRAVTDDESADELQEAIDSGSNPSGAAVADVSQADSNAQTGAYVQGDVQSIADLADANKAQINLLLASLRAAGLLDT